MNLTEPQAGSDVGALRTAATPATDGSWRIKGSKIFITWGEHELAENIVHLVLARTPGALAGTKGISLFLVPKFLPDAAGAFTRRNDLRCVSIEHKLGIHASPTCTMSFGDHDECVGWLIGPENAGMRAMFTMMNAARINVGLEGVAISERAYQGALSYARERVQSAPFGSKSPARIIEHPDVRRMLMTLRANTQATRAIAYYNGAAIDRSRVEPDPEKKQAARGLADLLTPITKAYATDTGVEMASLAIQVFGGMGFIEETGAAQHYRDIRIAPIYEGTNGIQALDLVGRKLHADGGAHWRRLLDDLNAVAVGLSRGGELEAIRRGVTEGLSLLRQAAERVMTLDAKGAACVATPLFKNVWHYSGRRAAGQTSRYRRAEARATAGRCRISDGKDCDCPLLRGRHPPSGRCFTCRGSTWLRSETLRDQRRAAGALKAGLGGGRSNIPRGLRACVN